MFQISPYAKYIYFHERPQYFFIKKIYDIYKVKYHSFLSIHASGFRKYRPDMDMSNIYLLKIVSFHHVESFVLLFILIIL